MSFLFSFPSNFRGKYYGEPCGRPSPSIIPLAKQDDWSFSSPLLPPSINPLCVSTYVGLENGENTRF